MICNTCGHTKPEEAFAWRNQQKGVRQSQCRSCHKEYAAQHYKDNKQIYVDRAKVSNVGLRAANKRYMLDYLKTHPCVDCGESDIEVLEFDHRELIGNKASRVGSFLQSRKRLIEEIAKCDVRCSNCHTRRTRRQMGWSRIDED